jgi:hypothetical protein
LGVTNVPFTKEEVDALLLIEQGLPVLRTLVVQLQLQHGLVPDDGLKDNVSELGVVWKQHPRYPNRVYIDTGKSGSTTTAELTLPSEWLPLERLTIPDIQAWESYELKKKELLDAYSRAVTCQKVASQVTDLSRQVYEKNSKVFRGKHPEYWALLQQGTTPDASRSTLVCGQAEEAEKLLTGLSTYIRYPDVFCVFKPRVISSQVGHTVHYTSADDLNPQYFQYICALADQGLETTWLAPAEALDGQGSILPLSPAAESFCLAGVSGEPKGKLTPKERAWLAWRWLILSHNDCQPAHRVTIPRKLHFGYERKRATMKDSTVLNPKDLQAAVTQAMGNVNLSDYYHTADISKSFDKITGLLSKMVAPYGKWDAAGRAYETEGEIPGGDPIVRSANNILVVMDELLTREDQGVPVLPVALPEEELEKIREDLLDHLESSMWERFSKEADKEEEKSSGEPLEIKVHGVSYVRTEHTDPASLPAGTVSVFQDGRLYVQVASVPLPSSPKKKEKGKKKAEAGGVALSPTTPAPKPKKEKKPELAGNPLGVKGNPRSSSLTEVQRTTLRKFFQLPDESVPQEEWERLSKKEKTKARLSRSIPRWAVSAVLQHDSNLEKIVKGDLTKENFNSQVKVTPKTSAPKGDQVEATQSWVDTARKFKGVSLQQRPVTVREKAFKKAYSALLARYGDLPCFPKPKQRAAGPKSAGQPAFVGGGLAPLQPLLELAKFLGQLQSAARG